jgi:hypothetical protein
MSSRKAAFTVFIVCFSAGILLGAVTQIDLTSQVKGILPIGNGGTGLSSVSAGVTRSSGSALSSAELSGDASTSGSNAVTVVKVNGTSVPTNSAADQTVVTTASATGSWAALPNCTGTCILQYSTSTHTFSTGTALTGSFSDDETPTGTINGVNTTFTLGHTPSGTSLMLFKNGQKLEPGGADFSLSTATITMTAAPKTGDILTASYRY